MSTLIKGFIVLTLDGSKKTLIRVNYNTITTYFRGSAFTVINHGADDVYNVKETPEEIDGLIRTNQLKTI